MNAETIWKRESVLELLKTREDAVARAILTLFKRQTADEQSCEATQHRNGRGFNSRDAEFLSSVAKALPQWNNRLTPRQLKAARAMIPKYWRQLLDEIAERGGRVDYKSGKTRKDEIAAPEAIDEIEDAELEELASLISTSSPTDLRGMF